MQESLILTLLVILILIDYMLINHFKIAWRNLLKGKMYSIINPAGLSIGTAVVILLALYVHDEWTFDQFHAKSDRIYLC